MSPDDALALLVRLGDLIARQDHPEAAHMPGIPIRFGHLGAVRFEPVKIFDFRSVNRPAVEEVAPPKDRLRLAQAQQLAGKIEEGALFSGEIPIEPGHRRILAIGIVIAVLRLAEFITGQQHRHALGKEERGEEIALLPRPQGVDACVGCWALEAAVPTLIIVRPVAIFFAVGFVMLVVVSSQGRAG